jgi:hypothetical protein
MMRLVAAPVTSAFVRFAYRISGPLVFPFRGLFGPVSASRPVEWAALAAMAAYGLVAWGVMRLGWAVAAHSDVANAAPTRAGPPAGVGGTSAGGDVAR